MGSIQIQQVAFCPSRLVNRSGAISSAQMGRLRDKMPSMIVSRQTIGGAEWGEEGTGVVPERRSDRLCEMRNKSGRQREEDRGSLKERNGRIGAFPPCGHSTFMTRLRGRKHRKDSVHICEIDFCSGAVWQKSLFKLAKGVQTEGKKKKICTSESKPGD